METKVARKYFGLADFLEEQAYLEQQHADGWKFVRFQGLTKYTFEKCNPEQYIYQLDYKEDDKDNDEYIQMFVDCGWEYIMKYQTWYYFRKPKSDISSQDNGIFTDKESKIEMMKKVMTKLLIPTAICLCFPGMLFLTRAIDFNDKDIVYICIISFYAIVMTFLLSISVYNVIKLNKLIQVTKYPIDEDNE
ncbi:MAG: DUF2812 domain-containing protein [Coprobacillus sp.]